MNLNLVDYLPHRPPMLLLNKVRSLSLEKLESEVFISEASAFFENEKVPAWVGVEYMAQTAALYSGAQSHQSGEPAGVGFLLGVRGYHSEVSFFHSGQHLFIEASPLLIQPPLVSFDCKIRIQKKVVATASLNAFRPPKEFLDELASEEQYNK